MLLRIAALAFVLGAFYYYFFVQPRTEETEVRSALSAVHLAQKKYHGRWQKFSPDIKQINFEPSNAVNTLVFLNEKDIPGAVFAKVPTEAMPFVQDQSYQILGVFKNQVAYTIDQNGKLVRHELISK